MIVQNLMKATQIASNGAVNVGAIGATWSLGMAQAFSMLQGVLPTLALVLSSLCATALLVVHIKNSKLADRNTMKADLEIELLRKKVEDYKRGD